MPFDDRAKNDPSYQNNTGTEYNSRQGNLSLPDIIQQNPQTPKAKRQRQLARWRIPALGFIDMYLNPQQIQIQERKIITKQRTAGGYLIQYYGEELMELTISGSTGASGIEGINILRRVYRAEQEAFQKVEQTLADRINSMTRQGSLSSLSKRAQEDGIGGLAGSLISDTLGGAKNPPLLPTLGSLAAAVEFYYQGWVFKGYFMNFGVTESVQNGVGVFDYNMSFTVTDRRGFRTNNMPWHRQPATIDTASGKMSNFNSANNDITPLNFSGEK